MSNPTHLAEELLTAKQLVWCFSVIYLCSLLPQSKVNTELQWHPKSGNKKLQGFF